MGKVHDGADAAPDGLPFNGMTIMAGVDGFGLGKLESEGQASPPSSPRPVAERMQRILP